ncbi:MAG: T9SS type A sorting domain-containing protein [Bacteroidales bacterium]|nr:T9SS type A sorting domain-containing protein [Bacteroidales bacterium]
MPKFILSILMMVAIGGSAQTPFINFYDNGTQFISSNSVFQNSDGSYLMVGRADTVINAIPGPAGFIRKTDASGNLISTDYYSIPNTTGLEFRKIIRTMDDNYVVVGMVDHACVEGTTLQDVFISKIDVSGNMLWYKVYGGEITDIGVDVLELSDGDLIIQSWFARNDAGFTPFTAFHLIKTDPTGDSLWTRHYYHNDQVEQFATTVVETSDGGFALAGSINDQNGGLKGYLIKTDSQGMEQWNRTIDSTSGNYSELVSVYSNEGLITVIGKIYGVDTENTIISEFSNSGSLVRTNTLNENDAQIFASTRTHDGGYALTGETTNTEDPQPVIIKLDSSGNKLWRKDLSRLVQHYPTAIIQAMDNDFILTGNGAGFNPYSVFLAKTADSATILNTTSPISMDNISIYPNPATKFIHVDFSDKVLTTVEVIEIMNMQGRVVKSVGKTGFRNGSIDVSDLSPGYYFIAFFNSGGRMGVSKLIRE